MQQIMKRNKRIKILVLIIKIKNISMNNKYQLLKINMIFMEEIGIKLQICLVLSPITSM